MGVFTITFPDQYADRIRDALCARWGYNITSGLTKVQFITKKLADDIKNEVVEHESSNAARLADSTARTAAKTDITIT